MKNTNYDESLSLKNAPTPKKQVSRTGVYGVAMKNGKLLLIKQPRGPYKGKYDFPGGGFEFGESPEQALRREFIEEVVMGFDSMTLLDNLTAVIDVPKTSEKESYTFYQIGMIYYIEGLYELNNGQKGDLQSFWVDQTSLTQEQCSALLWKYTESAS